MSRGQLVVLVLANAATAALAAYLTVYFTARRDHGTLPMPGIFETKGKQLPRAVPMPVGVI